MPTPERNAVDVDFSARADDGARRDGESPSASDPPVAAPTSNFASARLNLETCLSNEGELMH